MTPRYDKWDFGHDIFYTKQIPSRLLNNIEGTNQFQDFIMACPKRMQYKYLIYTEIRYMRGDSHFPAKIPCLKACTQLFSHN